MALPSAFDGGPSFGVSSDMPRMAGQAQLTPASEASGPLGLFGTAPMQPGLFSNPGPSSNGAPSQPSSSGNPAFSSGNPVGVPQPPQGAPSSGEVQAVIVASPPSAAAIAPPEEGGWSLGKLALAALIALVVTAGLTFAFLRLRGV